MTSNRNEYQGYLTGNKGGRCARLTILPLSYADFLKNSDSLNHLESKEPVQVGTGISLTFISTSINTDTHMPIYTYTVTLLGSKQEDKRFWIE